MQTGSPSITVIFSSHNGSRTLPAMLAALQQVTAPAGGWELIAVDNASNDSTAALLHASAADLPMTAVSEPRRGKNIALNAAIAQARGELLVFTDDDVLPAQDWLLQLQAAATAFPAHAIFGGAIRPHWPVPPPGWILRHVPIGMTYAITDPALPAGDVFPGLIWGPNMMVRRAVFDAGLRFNTQVGPAAGQYVMGSETEFNIRADAAGWRCAFVPQAVVQHMIRDFQMEKAWVLNRAYRFGRNMWNQEQLTGGQPGVPTVLGLPRWRLGSYLHHQLRALRAGLLGDADARFPHDWELHFLRGYLHQWRQSRHAGAGAG